MRIFLAGGGNAKDSRLIDNQFVKNLDLAKPLIYIPNAMSSRPYESCLEWLKSVMNPFGLYMIEMWDDLCPHLPVMDIAGIYIGGGDTMKLIKDIQKNNFGSYLLEAVKNGIPLYGGSAGAIILGGDIRTDPEIDSSKVAGLEIINGYSIACHYESDGQKAMQSLSENIHQRIIAIPEKSGGYVTEKILTNYGTEPLTIFRDKKIIHIAPSCSIEL
jgi:dipeptidase E